MKGIRRTRYRPSPPFAPTSSKARSLMSAERRTRVTVNNYITKRQRRELTIFFSFSSASVHSPPRVTAYIPNPSAATPTMSVLISLVLRSIELGESLADRAPVRSERGASSAAVKSSVERLGSSEDFGSEISPGATGAGSGVEGSALRGSLEGLEEDCDEAAGWLSDGSCRGFFDFLEAKVLALMGYWTKARRAGS